MKRVREMLAGQRPTLEVLSWLQEIYMPALCERFNQSNARRRLALYGGERIPQNERNLTDVRTRLGAIIEYELARLGNELLREQGIEKLFWSYVVAHRFPDLEIRNTAGERGLRLEVKCLQSLAEEKAANFDTLKKDLNPNTDFIAVIIWEWASDADDVKWDRAPRLEQAYVFHASTLAELRDFRWLNNPPATLGAGFQGFDLRYAVNCNDGVYNQEEGNYGKLLRIWSDDENHPLRESKTVKLTMQSFFALKENVVFVGLEAISRQSLLKLADSDKLATCKLGGKAVGFRAERKAFLLASRVPKGPLNGVFDSIEIDEAWLFSDKYQWRHFRRAGGQLQKVASGKKPKHILNPRRED